MLKSIHNFILTLFFSKWRWHDLNSGDWVNRRWNGRAWEYRRLSAEEELDLHWWLTK